jgi:hypothetical protein
MRDVLDLFRTIAPEAAAHAKATIWVALKDLEHLMTARIELMFNSGQEVSIDQALAVRAILVSILDQLIEDIGPELAQVSVRLLCEMFREMATKG